MKCSDNYYNVCAPLEMISDWSKKNPKATMGEYRAEKERIKIRRKDRNNRLKEKGYPTERRFQYKEMAERYAKEIENECGFRPAIYEQFDMAL